MARADELLRRRSAGDGAAHHPDDLARGRRWLLRKHHRQPPVPDLRHGRVQRGRFRPRWSPRGAPECQREHRERLGLRGATRLPADPERDHGNLGLRRSRGPEPGHRGGADPRYADHDLGRARAVAGVGAPDARPPRHGVSRGRAVAERGAAAHRQHRRGRHDCRADDRRLSRGGLRRDAVVVARYRSVALSLPPVRIRQHAVEDAGGPGDGGRHLRSERLRPGSDLDDRYRVQADPPGGAEARLPRLQSREREEAELGNFGLGFVF
jgi:hypothetical protein